ncbi:MAG TPA: hypothetical protein VMH87_19195 [Pseudomonadales bacterium]|nr:hypothetical protein [Pseudomonadales bacterium]
MGKLRINCFTMSLDGFGAGPNQDINNPLGVGGKTLHQWFYPTRAFQKMLGKSDGATGIDNDFAEEGMAASAHGFWAAICLDRFAAPGRMTSGKAGGEIILRITLRFLC